MVMSELTGQGCHPYNNDGTGFKYRVPDMGQ